MAVELLALVKHDCPVCDQLLPALDAAAAGGAPLRILSQSSAADTAEQARRVELRATPGLDDDLDASERFDPDAVPTLILLDTGEERGRVEGLHRAGIAALADRAGVALALDGLPEQRPGCASITRDPEVAAGSRSGGRGPRDGCVQERSPSASSRTPSRLCTTAG